MVLASALAWPSTRADGGRRRYDASCAVAQGVLGIAVDGMQDVLKQERVRGYGAGMGRRGSRADEEVVVDAEWPCCLV